MDNLTFVLRQNIGVYYKDRAWAERLFNEVAYHYPKEMIERVMKNQYEMKVVLKDTSSISFIKANETCRGRKFDKIILQPGIDDEIVRTIVMPTFNYFNRRPMIFSEDKKLEYWMG